MAHEPVTQLGGPGGAFPATLWTMILGARDEKTPLHLEKLCAMYWKPVYWLIRLRWNRTNEDAKDLTQEFFATFVEKDYLKSVSPDRGRFRSFVRAALENFLRQEVRDANRLKRGGGVLKVSMDAEDSSLFQLPSKEEPPERLFDRLWAQSLVQDSIDALRRQYQASGRENAFRVFEAYNLGDEEPPSYRQVSERLGTNEDFVRNALRNVRAELRTILRERVLQSVADPSELDAEMNELFGTS